MDPENEINISKLYLKRCCKHRLKSNCNYPHHDPFKKDIGNPEGRRRQECSCYHKDTCINVKICRCIKLCHRARNSDDITQQNYRKISTNLLSGQTSGKWISMSLNVLLCTSDTTTCKVTITCPINNCRQQSNSGIWESSSTRTSSGKNKQRKAEKTANRVLGFIASNFRYKNKELIQPLYKSLVRPHLEQSVQFWSPDLRRDIEKNRTDTQKSSKDDSWKQKPQLPPANPEPSFH